MATWRSSNAPWPPAWPRGQVSTGTSARPADREYPVPSSDAAPPKAPSVARLNVADPTPRRLGRRRSPDRQNSVRRNAAAERPSLNGVIRSLSLGAGASCYAPRSAKDFLSSKNPGVLAARDVPRAGHVVTGVRAARGCRPVAQSGSSRAGERRTQSRRSPAEERRVSSRRDCRRRFSQARVDRGHDEARRLRGARCHHRPPSSISGSWGPFAHNQKAIA